MALRHLSISATLYRISPFSPLLAALCLGIFPSTRKARRSSFPRWQSLHYCYSHLPLRSHIRPDLFRTAASLRCSEARRGKAKGGFACFCLVRKGADVPREDCVPRWKPKDGARPVVRFPCEICIDRNAAELSPEDGLLRAAAAAAVPVWMSRSRRNGHKPSEVNGGNSQSTPLLHINACRLPTACRPSGG